MTQRHGSSSGYSTREVARFLGLTAERVRSFVRSDFVRPGRGLRREYRFSFQDLVLLRAAQGLVAARVPPRRVRQALARLRRDLPQGRSLTSLRISADRHRVMVRDGSELWEPESGQLVLDFEVSELAEKSSPQALQAAPEARTHGKGRTAEQCFELALELEATAPQEAKAAYLETLRLEPRHADGHLNLGRLLHEEGDVEGAVRHYRRAAVLQPDDATAVFNLGVGLQDLGRLRRAVEAYRKTIEVDPGYADAYFNLAGLYEELGEKAVAIQNLKIYKSLTDRER